MSLSVRLMQLTDNWVGSPLIWILWGIDRVFNLFRRGTLQSQHSVTNIVLSKYFGLGSIVLSIPLLRLLREAYPNARITFVTFETNRALVETIPQVDFIRTVSRRPLGFVRDTIATILYLRSHRPDIYLDLEFFSRYSTLVMYLTGPRLRVGFHSTSTPNRLLLTHPVKLTQIRPIRQVFLAMGSEIGLTIPEQGDPHVDLRLPERNVKLAAKLAMRLNGRPLVLFNPAVGDVAGHLRKWNNDNWRALAGRLISRWPEAAIVLTGGAGARVDARAILAGIGNPEQVVDLATELSLLDFVALLHHCSLLVTTDSAPVHIAAGLDVPTVALYGPESPMIYGHDGTRFIAVYKNLYCSPCLNVLDGKRGVCWYDNECMKTMTCSEVFEAVCSLIDNDAATQVSTAVPLTYARPSDVVGSGAEPITPSKGATQARG